MTPLKLPFSVILLFAFCLAGPPALCANRPNIVWLVSEDNSLHYLKLFDRHGAPTPRIAELAAHGLSFDQAYSNAPVCSVARTTLATGCYAPRIGTQFHRKHIPVPLPEGVRMFPELLRQAGYYTANNRKTDFNAIPGNEVWDENSGRASWRNRNPDQPFFYMQSFGVTHESSLHFTAEQMARHKTQTDPKTVFVFPQHPQTELFRYTNAYYRDRIMQMDQQIGAVVDKLAEDGLLEDTFIFYFGDHGGVLPGSKGYAYDTGLHVPLVIRVPKKYRHLCPYEAGSRTSAFVSFVDFGPTVLHLAGVSVPIGMDGKPFLGKDISADTLKSRDSAFGHADRFDEKYDLVRTLRKGRYEYVRSFQPFNFDGLQNNYRYRMLAYQQWRELYHQGRLNDLQKRFFEPRPAELLYDLEKDPHETSDLSDNPELQSVLLELREQLNRQLLDMPDLSFYPESVLAKQAFTNPVAFGKRHRDRIAEYLRIANLQLQPFDKARPHIEQALKSSDATARYWALITCSAFGDSARQFANVTRQIARTDNDLLVRTRALEFLGLIEAADPSDDLTSILSQSSDGIEAGLILNTITLLRDGKPGYRFTIQKQSLNPTILKNDTVARRLEYLAP